MVDGHNEIITVPSNYRTLRKAKINSFLSVLLCKSRSRSATRLKLGDAVYRLTTPPAMEAIRRTATNARVVFA